MAINSNDFILFSQLLCCFIALLMFLFLLRFCFFSFFLCVCLSLSLCVSLCVCVCANSTVVCYWIWMAIFMVEMLLKIFCWCCCCCYFRTISTIYICLASLYIFTVYFILAFSLPPLSICIVYSIFKHTIVTIRAT